MKVRILLSSVIVAALTACGGGPAPTPPVVATPAPTVSVLISQPKVSVNTPVTVTWSSSNATTCTGLDAMTAGAKPTAGSATITPTAGGQYTYTISCDGAGGTAKQSVALVVPFPVKATSYANAKEMGIQQINLPTFGGEYSLAYAVADFFQSGNMDLLYVVNHVTAGSVTYAQMEADPATYYADARFMRKQADGSWLQIGVTMKTCAAPRKAAVADLNHDGYPDVHFVCHGIEVVVPQFVGTNGSGFPGDIDKIFMSNGSGGFTSQDVGTRGYHHGGALGDVNGDGWADILVSDGFDMKGTYFLLNNKNGTFTKDTLKFDAALNLVLPGHFTVELIDINGDGKLDVFLGDDQEALHILSVILYADANGRYTNKVDIPLDTANPIIYDVTFVNNNLYVSRTNNNWNGQAIQKVNVSTMSASEIFQSSKVYFGAAWQWSWAGWWLPVTKNGVLGIAPYFDEMSDIFIPIK